MKDDDIKRNRSGYYDPTAYYAIKNVEKDRRRDINRKRVNKDKKN